MLLESKCETKMAQKKGVVGFKQEKRKKNGSQKERYK